MRDLILNAKKKLHDNRNEFRAIFGKPLEEFWDLTGFDIVKFNDWLQCPDDIAISAFVDEKYGEKAQSLIASLL